MSNTEKIWYVHRVQEKKTYGPFSFEELKQLIKEGRVGGLDRVAKKGESWQTAYSVPEVSALFVQRRPKEESSAPQRTTTPVPSIQTESKKPLISLPLRKQVLLGVGVLVFIIILIFVWSNKNVHDFLKGLFRSKELQVIEKEATSLTGTPEEHVAKGRELMNAGIDKFPSAEEEFQIALRLNSTFEPALFGLQELYYEWGKTTGDNTRLNESIKYGNEILRVNQNNADSYILLAFAYNELGKKDESKVSAEKAFRLRDNDWRITYLLAELYLLEPAMRNQAIEFFEKTVKIKPEQYESHKRLAQLYEEDKKYADAVSHLEKLAVLAPEESGIFFSLGLNYSRIDKLRESVRAYKRCIELAPDHVEARINLSKLLFERLEDYDDAEKNIEQLLTGYAAQLTDFDRKYFSVSLGRIYLNKEKYEEAKNRFLDVLNADPNHIDAHFYLGDAYFAMNMYHEAEKEYKEVLRLNPNSAAVHLALAKVMEKIERRDLAKDELKRVLEIDPTFAEANYLLGKYQDMDGYYFEAMEYYKNAIRNNPEYLEAHYALAQDAFKLGENKLAIDEFKRVKALDSKFGDVTYYLGEAYFAEGNIKSALREYREYLNNNPDGRFRSEAEKRLRSYR